MSKKPEIRVHFSDYFKVAPKELAKYGAFNISLINDVPLFIDPFLLFNSTKSEYKDLHEGMIRYLRFLRDKAEAEVIDKGLLEGWFTFREVKQNWLGYSLVGNDGSALGMDFAHALHKNLNSVFPNFGQEEITKGSHIEKLSFVTEGVGRDNISDFATNLIKEFLLRYTQTFALQYLQPIQRKLFPVKKVRFNYETETWETDTFELPYNVEQNDFVLLTPKDILTKDDIWINKHDIFGLFDDIAETIPNHQLRAQINNYFLKQLPDKPKAKDRRRAISGVIHEFPEIIEYYIRLKEDRGEQAIAESELQVQQTQSIFVDKVKSLIEQLLEVTPFYESTGDTYQEALNRVKFLKDVIENKGGYKIFYLNGKPISNEKDLHILYRLTWYATLSDVSREVDDGRGPADFKISKGAKDKTIVEFKLASNSKLKQNLEKQAQLYQNASDAKKSIKVILFFTEQEELKVTAILNDLNLVKKEDVIVIDGRADNKPSASKA